MADVNVGSNGVLRMAVSIIGGNPGGNFHDVFWQLAVLERAPGTLGFANGTTAAVEVYIGGASVGSVLYSGSFNWDFRPGGQQSVVIASGTYRVAHNANGTAPQVVFQGRMGASGTSTLGGPASADQGVSLPTLQVEPNTPTGCSAARVSDTQVAVSWSQSHPSNGQPSSNTVRRRINGGAWGILTSISPANSVSVGAAANQKLEYSVNAANGAGPSAYSAASAPIYTSPAAPTGVSAAKDAALDITVSWTPQVGFTEHQHQVEFSTNGGTSWSTLATVAAGTSSYKHVSPNAAFAHLYRVRARNTATGNLTSAWVQSNTVQLLAPPNAPTLAALPNFVDRTVALTVAWAHNPVDTTPQTAYEMQFSTNGGSSYSSTGKVTSATSQRVIAANAYAANVALTVRVRTWGEATTGGADGTGASPWSTTDTVVFKTRPVATIPSPSNGSTWDQAELDIELGFSQAQGATFVQATIVLSQGATVLETVQSTTLASTILETPASDGGTYTVTATVLDSNGLTSSPVASTFSVDFTEPVVATVSAEYLDDSGIVQLSVEITAPSAGEAEAIKVTIERTIDGVRETIVAGFPVTDGAYTFLDTTPTTNGTNQYRAITESADGATARSPLLELVTSERVWAYLSTGAQFDRIVRFSRRLTTGSAPSRERALVAMSNRRFPVALFGPGASLSVPGSATVLSEQMKEATGDEGSSIKDIEEFLLTAGRVCYRDPDHRIFGTVEGELVNRNGVSADFRYTVEKTS